MFTTENLPAHDVPLLHINQLGTTQAEAISAIESFKNKYGQYPFITPQSGSAMAVSALYYAVGKNYNLMAEQLLEDGFDVDLGLIDLKQQQQLTTPLLLAVRENKEDMVPLLLKYKADALKISPEGLCVLHYVQTVSQCQLIMEYAQSNGCLKYLLNLQSKDKLNPFVHACRKGNAEIAKQLVSIENLADNYENRNTFLHEARQAYFLYPDQQITFDQICDILRPSCQAFIRKRQGSNAPYLPVGSAYTEIFGKDSLLFYDEHLDKIDALKLAIAQTYAIFNSPTSYAKYLQFMNEEFVRYLKESQTEYIRINPNMYYYKEFDGTVCPIPTPNFESYQQAHLFKEFLIAVLKQYGLAEHAYKWIGFIPASKANTMVAHGDFCVESTLGLGLFHNTLSHMIQLVLTIYIFENEEISKRYENDKTLNIKDILEGLVGIPWRGTHNLWAPARDTRKLKRSALSDPYELGSILMRGNNEMADAMIDIFCRGLLKLVDVFNESGKYDSLTVESFTDKMNDFYMENFNIPEFLFRHDFVNAAQKTTEQNNGQIDTDGKTYAIVPKNYKYNVLYKPRPCHLKNNTSSGSQDYDASLFI